MNFILIIIVYAHFLIFTVLCNILPILLYMYMFFQWAYICPLYPYLSNYFVFLIRFGKFTCKVLQWAHFICLHFIH